MYSNIRISGTLSVAASAQIVAESDAKEILIRSASVIGVVRISPPHKVKLHVHHLSDGDVAVQSLTNGYKVGCGPPMINMAIRIR